MLEWVRSKVVRSVTTLKNIFSKTVFDLGSNYKFWAIWIIHFNFQNLRKPRKLYQNDGLDASFTKKETLMSPEVNRGKKFRIMGQISNLV